MKIFLSLSPLFSPPNAFMVFGLPSGEAALAGTSWFSLDVGNVLVTVAVQKPATMVDWTLPRAFSLNLLPQGFKPRTASSFPHLSEAYPPLPRISDRLGPVVDEEVPFLEKSPVVFICREGQLFEAYNQHLVVARVIDAFIHGKKEQDLSADFFTDNFPLTRSCGRND